MMLWFFYPYTSSFSVWLDTEEITAGCDWHAVIGTGLDKCQALIAVISNKYIMSRYCKSELYTANGDQKHTFPVIVENVDFSGTERARRVKYVVAGINWTICFALAMTNSNYVCQPNNYY